MNYLTSNVYGLVNFIQASTKYLGELVMLADNAGIASVDGGPDENTRYPKTLAVAVPRFRKYNLNVYKTMTHSPGFSAILKHGQTGQSPGASQIIRPEITSSPYEQEPNPWCNALPRASNAVDTALPGLSAYSYVERQTAPLSKELSGIQILLTTHMAMILMPQDRRNLEQYDLR